MQNQSARPFSGEVNDFGESEDPGMWLEHYQVVAEMNQWETEAQRLRNIPAHLTGEAEQWYSIYAHYIRGGQWKWDDFVEHFIERFRPSDYVDELEERLRSPVQMEGESVRAYGDRYKCLHVQAAIQSLNLDFCRKYWIAGLHTSLRREVIIADPTTMDAAIINAMKVERADKVISKVQAQTLTGKKPGPKTKSPSADMAPSSYIADEAAGLVDRRTPRHGESRSKGSIDAHDFEEFHRAMGPEVAEPDDVDELVRRFTAWKLYSRVYTDQAKLKSIILKTTVKTKAAQGVAGPSGSSGPSCAYCKEAGHHISECKRREANNTRVTGGRPTLECWYCSEKGHISSQCPRHINGDPPVSKEKSTETKVSAKKVKVSFLEEESDSESDNEVVYAFKASAARVAKRKSSDEPMRDAPRTRSETKKTKTAKRNVAIKSVDPEVLKFFKETKIPFELVARHGASLESQAKRAIKVLYGNGKEYRKQLNPLVADGKLSHALIVAGKLGKTPCLKLVIDPGCSSSILDVNKAREAGIGIKKKSKLVIQLANGEFEPPIGETAFKETIDIGGVEVRLRMPVMDSKGSYDILLGRDWLHAVSAVGNYRMNQYVISKDGKEVTLAGRRYTTAEVELPDGSEESDKREESSSSSEEEESPEVVIASTYRAQCFRLEGFDAHPTRKTLVEGAPHLSNVEEKCSIPEISTEGSALSLRVDQLEEIDINPDLTNEQRVKVNDLLWEYRDCFANSLEELGSTHMVEHEINLKPDARPYYCPRTKRFAPKELDFLREDIERELSAGKIIEFDGPWCAPITLAIKKEGSYRKCVTYNGLNDRTERESWPLPNIEELLDRMGGNQWYSACDGFSGYYAVKMKQEDIPKTMFRTPFGTYAYTVMPFGLKNAPHTYSRLAYKTFAHLIGKSLEAYIDDTATYSTTFVEHVQHLTKTFEALRSAGIRLKAAKCHFFYPEVEFVGHLVGAYGLKMMPGKVERVQTWPIPTDRTKLRSFLGLASYYRRFVKGFAQLSIPLTRLTSNTVAFDWGRLIKRPSKR